MKKKDAPSGSQENCQLCVEPELDNGLFRLLIESANQGILVHRENKPLYANQALAAIYGYETSAEVLALQSTFELFPEKDRGRRKKVHADHLRGKAVGEEDIYAGLKKNGDVIWIGRRSFPIDWKGAPAICSMRLDVTDRVNAEQRARESDHQYKTLIEFSPDAIYIHVKGHIVFANPAAAKLLGVGAPEDLLGQNLLELIHPDDREKIRVRSASLFKNKTSLEPLEQKLLTKDGRVVVVESGANFIEFNREPAGLVIIRDITARRETEEALKRTQESFQSAIENLNDGFALFDSDFRLVYANDEYKKLHHHVADIIVAGVSAEELVRTTVKRGVIAAAKGREEEFVRERLDQYANPSNEPIIRTYESGITLSLRESRTPEGGFVTSQTNITKQVRAEKILRDAVESLPNGFALFDKDDRLVLCNQNYIDEHPEIADILIIGTTFEEQIRLREEKGLRQSQVDGKRISLEERIERHHNPRGPMIVPIADGRVHQLQEVKTIDGGTALIRTDITSLIKAEEALRENEELYRTLVNFSPNAIYFHQDNTIVFANPAAVKIFGAKSADEIIGTSNLRHVPEGLEEIVEKRIKRILATGESVVIDQKYVQIDGTVIDVEAQGTVISYRGQPAVMVIARDISERKKAEEALRRNEERFRGGIEALQEGFALFDNNDRLIIFNEEYKRLHPIVADMLEPGVRYEDLLRANVAAGLNVKANGREEEYIRERLELHRNPQGPLVRELIDGTWYIINESRTREGGTVEVQTDITELKKTQADLQNAHDDLEHRVEERTRNLRHEVAERQRTEEALRQSEARVAEAHSRLIDAIESFKDGLLLFDKNDCLILSNEAYRQSALDIADILSTGLTFEKLLRTRIERAVLEIGQKPVTEVWIEQRIEQHQNPTVPIERVTSDGRHFQLQEFKTQEGGTLIIRRDITEQRIVEQALMQAKSEADSANQAKSDFLSSMSHELRTPMNAILGFSQLLQSTPNAPLKEKQSQYVDHILQSGEHLLDLINQVLDFAKIESGTTNLVFQDTQLRDVITDCLALIETRAGERNIQVKDETKGIVFDAIWTDQTRLKQVLLNLLSNAVKYNQPSGRVSIRCVQRANNMLRVSVEDTGRGIPENLQAEVFQPFNRLGAEASKIEGTGIGLTITKQLIDQLGGDIGFESTVGEGSTFWVDLPLENDDIKETLSEKNKEIGE